LPLFRFSHRDKLVVAMQELERYYQYAEEGRRMAERAKNKDREALLKIAEAWENRSKLPNSASDEIISSSIAILMLSGAPRAQQDRNRLVETNSKSL
jgi:hypothetical protein